MRDVWALLLVTATACTASTAQVQRAREVSYQTDRAIVFREVKAAVESQYRISYWNERDGIVESHWKRIESVSDDNETRGVAAGGWRAAAYFRVRMVMSTLGPPWSVLVDGVAGQYRPELAVIYQYKHGVAGEPGWVQGRIDGMYVELYERLSTVAVIAPKPKPNPGATAVIRDGDLPTRCDAGQLDACALVAKDLMAGPKADLPRALALLTRGCDGGHAGSCGLLGFAHASGQGVPQDHAAADVLYERACTGGELDACANLGHALASGRAVAPDPTRARALFQTSCDGGIAHGCAGLGRSLIEGVGGPKDETRGRALLAQACQGGYAPACEAP